MLVWVCQYACLGWLLVILAPYRSGMFHHRKDIAQFFLMTLLIYGVYEWTVWMRNFVLTNEKRLVYSFANWDICPSGFVMQEINTLIFAALLSLVWLNWLQYYNQCRGEKPPASDPYSGITDTQIHDNLLKTYIHWQLCSVALALGFISFTSGFWTIIIHEHDMRYLVAALTIHLLWAVSWLIISLPLLTRWYRWYLIKSNAIRALWETDNVDLAAKEFRLSLIKESNPFSVLSFSASGAISIISFIFPVIQAFFK